MLLDLGLSPKVVTRMGRPRPSCSHRIHACQRSAKTAIFRYSEPAMGGTAAAILSGSPSAGTDARGLVRRSLREEHITRSRIASQTHANTTAPQAEPSRIRWRRVTKVQARSPPYKRLLQPRALLGVQRQRLPGLRVSKPCGVRTGANIITNSSLRSCRTCPRMWR